MSFAELLGLFLVGYGIWFAAKGVQQYLGLEKDWWRPLGHQKRYPYPVAGVLLGVCFVVMGLVFALRSLWVHSQSLVYVGGGIFGLVLVIGVAQPRLFHPRWYGDLQDRYGKKGMIRLKKAALQVGDDEWAEVAASKASFDAWVDTVMPQQARRPSRGYTKSGEGK